MAGRSRILVVDDNEMNRKLVVALLKPYGVKADVAESGSQALEMVQKQSYNLIFMDYRMPQMDGIEATRCLRRIEGDAFRKVPIIALTADDRTELRASFLQAGMNDILLKPIEAGQLQRILRDWLPQDAFETVKKETATDDTQGYEEFAQLKQVGIDAEEGIRACASRELYVSLLRDFYYLIDLKSVLLVKSLAQKQLKEYTIEVHALKNCARLIGAIELSEDFASLENLGNSGNIEAVKKGTPKVLATMHRYKEYLKLYGESEVAAKKPVDVAQIVECLRGMAEAVEVFDIDTVDVALEELDTYELPVECRKQAEQLKAYVADVALEDILRIARDMIGILEKED